MSTKDLPTGTITFLFTDIEGSTKLWEQAPDAVMHALTRHDEIIEGVVADNHGIVVKPRGEGDSRFAVFEQAKDGVSAAALIQMLFHAETWETPSPLKVRMSLHTGEADLRMGDYYGSVVNRAARLRSIGHGGQTLISRATSELIRETLPPGVTLQDQGGIDRVDPAIAADVGVLVARQGGNEPGITLENESGVYGVHPVVAIHVA